LTRPQITPWQRDNYRRALERAPNVIETLFWSYLLGYAGAERLFWEELVITDFEGPGGDVE
jgi:hypothetical protein